MIYIDIFDIIIHKLNYKREFYPVILFLIASQSDYLFTSEKL